MPWQEPPNNNGNDQNDSGNEPDNGRRQRPRNQQEELDQMAKELQDKLGRFFGGGKKSGASGESGQKQAGLPSLGLLIAIAAVLWLASGIYMVDDAEQAVEQRFGKYVETKQPGLRWHLPTPIESVTKVNTEVIRTATFDKTMLTQDENIVDIDLNVQYVVSNAADFLFNVRTPDATLKEVSRSAVREVVGKNDLDYIITEGREDIAAKTRERIQETLDGYAIGLKVTAVNLVDANFPTEVNDAVQDAIRAREDKETAIFEAQTYANDIVPKSRGEAAKRIEDSNAYRAQKVADAQGEASRFEQLLVEYEKAPEVTRKRLYLETVEQVYGNTSKVIMDSNGGSGGNLIYLPVDQLLKSGKDTAKNSDSTRTGSSSNITQTRPAVQPAPTTSRERPSSRGGR